VWPKISPIARQKPPWQRSRGVGRFEWARDKIRVLNVAPGYIETDLNREWLATERTQSWIKRRVPVGRPGQPDEVARLVGCLMTEEIGFLSGETIYIDGAHGINH
jgi:NAD(P)-dependent dehydrogenase (short-subunit alcohol dehydrogenase family)